MNNKEICRFINSKDIRKYLLDTKYEFSTAEAAWLVYQCYGISLKEKFKAWEDIIDTMPDGSINSYHFMKPYESIHQVIREYISQQKNLLDIFYEKSPNAVYQYKTVYLDESGSFDDSYIYSSFENCYNELENEVSMCDDDLDYCVIRRREADIYKYIDVVYSNDLKLRRIGTCRYDNDDIDWEIYLFFDLLWFHFPVPYKEGDILYHPSRTDSKGFCNGPVVMTSITPIDFEKNGRTLSDTTDMTVSGYFQFEDGLIYRECNSNYMDYEYCPKELLTGRRRLLKTISNYIKGEIPLDLLLAAYHTIMLEERYKELAPSSGWYTREGLEFAGLKVENADVFLD